MTLGRRRVPKKAVIFDLDGVIVDSEPRHERAYLEVVREIGYGATHGLRFADYIGRSDKELWVDFIARNKPAHTLEDLLARKRRRVLDIIRLEQPVFPGVPELVRELRVKYRLAIASGSEPPIIEAVLRLHGLHQYFSAVVSASEVPRGKPDPIIFLRAAELLEVPPETCCVIEDSKPGIAAGLAAGMIVIAITNTHSREELSDANHVVSTYAQIGDLLLGAPGERQP